MQESTFDLEKALRVDGFEFVIGIDEAGRGPLAGPVVASAVCLKNYDNLEAVLEKQAEFSFIRDSKKLSEKQREKIFDFIQEHFYVGVGICNHETIDRINILEATFLAMKSALFDLKKTLHYQDNPHIIIVDGNKEIPNLSYSQKAIVGGDKVSKTISAASIVAKVTRDRIMLEMNTQYPEYGFLKHKGYGTKMHMDALLAHGPCKIHRKSFAPVTRLVKKHK